MIKNLYKVGNGNYVLLPKDFMKQLDINGKIDIILRENEIVIRRVEEEKN